MTQGMGFNPHYCRHQRLWVPGLRSAWPPGVKGEPTWLALYGPWNVSAARCAQDDLKIVYAPRWDSDLGPRNDSNRFSKARGEAPAPALPGSRMCNLKLSMAQVCGFAFPILMMIHPADPEPFMSTSDLTSSKAIVLETFVEYRL